MKHANDGEMMEIPLFPLGTVLFPEGLLPLRIFEPRYMDMVKTCLRDESCFGVCLISEGEEVLMPGQPPAMPADTGTLARIAEWDMPQLGVLNIMAQGGERFTVLDRWIEPSGLQKARVQIHPHEAAFPLPHHQSRLISLLHRLYAEMGRHAYPPPYRMDDAVWLAWRFCELMPLPPALKLELLEMDNTAERLEEIYRFCAGQGLLET